LKTIRLFEHHLQHEFSQFSIVNSLGFTMLTGPVNSSGVSMARGIASRSALPRQWLLA
jgi:hypothetical protein